MARYIDADRLKEHIKDLPTWWADYGGVYGQAMKYPEGMFDCEDILGTIDNQLTADVVEVKYGHWIEKEEVYGDVYYTCSNCNNDWTTIDGTPQENFMNYCPNCGAKMDGGKEE